MANTKKESSSSLGGSILMVSTLIFSMIFSFISGSAYRTFYLQDSPSSVTSVEEKVEVPPMCVMDTKPVIEHDEKVDTEYTSKYYPDVPGIRKSTDVFVEIKYTGDDDEYDYDDDEDDDEDDDDEEEEDEEDDDDDEDDEEEVSEEEDRILTKNEPSGQNLIVDIKNLNADFLDSEACLINTLTEVMTKAGLPPMLSHHCHGFEPKGVTCVGLLAKGHFSFHTWPEEGIISLDIYTAPFDSLLHVMPILKEHFGIHDSLDPPTCSVSDNGENSCPVIDYDPPRAYWQHKLRGFRTKTQRLRTLEHDLPDYTFGSGPTDYLLPIASNKSIFQEIDIWEVIQPRYGTIQQYEKSLHGDPSSYERRNPELFLPNRLVFLDGVVQSNYLGDEGYHEALVQPAMFAHSNPRRVAIVGGGEGATLREALKHKTVDLVKMVEIDQVMVEVSREHLPTWNTCGDIKGSTESCFDEPRADVLYEDAVAWFLNHKFHPAGSPKIGSTKMDEEEFDVVIVDALDPQDTVVFADIIYNDPTFLKSIYDSLSPEGLMVMQLGPSPDYTAAYEEDGPGKNRPRVFNMMVRLGFESIQVYEEVHSGFEDPWSFMIACKSMTCRDHWYQSAADLQLAIRERILPTNSGKPQLKYFDGATMSRYKTRMRSWEEIWCRFTFPPHPECDSFRRTDSKQYVSEVTSDHFYWKEGAGLVSDIDIKEGDVLMIDQQINSLHFSKNTKKLSIDMGGVSEKMDPVADFMEKNAYDMKISPNDLHAPAGKWNLVGKSDSPNVANVYSTDEFGAKINSDGVINSNMYNPVVERRFNHQVTRFKASKDIAAGEVISL